MRGRNHKVFVAELGSVWCVLCFSASGGLSLITGLSMISDGVLIPIERACAGNLVVVEGIAQHLLHSGTVTSTESVCRAL